MFWAFVNSDPPPPPFTGDYTTRTWGRSSRRNRCSDTGLLSSGQQGPINRKYTAGLTPLVRADKSAPCIRWWTRTSYRLWGTAARFGERNCRPARRACAKGGCLQDNPNCTAVRSWRKSRPQAVVFLGSRNLLRQRTFWRKICSNRRGAETVRRAARHAPISLPRGTFRH